MEVEMREDERIAEGWRWVAGGLTTFSLTAEGKAERGQGQTDMLQ